MHAWLLVDRQGLDEAFRVLAKWNSSRTRAEAVLRFDGKKLRITLQGTDVTARARGSWEGEARVPGFYLVRLRGRLPRRKELPLRVTDEGLSIGSLRLPARWQPGARRQIRLPIDAALGAFLALPGDYSEKEIEESGLLPALREAEKRMGKIVGRALRVLAPLEVTRADLHALVLDVARRRHGRQRGDPSEEE